MREKRRVVPLHQPVKPDVLGAVALVDKPTAGSLPRSAKKGSTMLAAMQNLGVMPSFSRPRVSNDNAHAETLFRTAKYCPLWPEKPFETLDEARAWVHQFVQ